MLDDLLGQGFKFFLHFEFSKLPVVEFKTLPNSFFSKIQLGAILLNSVHLCQVSTSFCVWVINQVSTSIQSFPSRLDGKKYLEYYFVYYSSCQFLCSNLKTGSAFLLNELSLSTLLLCLQIHLNWHVTQNLNLLTSFCTLNFILFYLVPLIFCSLPHNSLQSN